MTMTAFKSLKIFATIMVAALFLMSGCANNDIVKRENEEKKNPEHVAERCERGDLRRYLTRLRGRGLAASLRTVAQAARATPRRCALRIAR